MDFNMSAESVMDGVLKTGQMDWKEFLESVWEKRCHHFAVGGSREASGNLWNEMVENGWQVLTQMMDTTHPIGNDATTTTATATATTGDQAVVPPPPLLFRDLQPMDDPEEIQRLFGNSLYAAYLAGTSIVWNHADQVSPSVAALCENLQKPKPQQSGGRPPMAPFPHAYANAYLTPPHSQTVPAHADDRDVLVFQLLGCKHWKVYQRVPILHPYPHEQVGKGSLPVPESVLQGPLAFDGCLSPGDVLYLPRGMVHEASTARGSSTTTNNNNDLSFHITVALATHDWTMAGNLTRMIQSALTEMIPTKRSLLPTPIHRGPGSSIDREGRKTIACGGSVVDVDQVQNQLDTVFETLQRQITARTLLQSIHKRIETHNARASPKRSALMAAAAAVASLKSDSTTDAAASSMDRVVGHTAALHIALETLLRVATPSEKEYAQSSLPKEAPRAGLTVRDGVGDEVASVVGAIKGGQQIRVRDFPRVAAVGQSSYSLCDLTALSLAKRAVQLGAFAIVVENDDKEEAPSPKRQRTTVVSIE